MIENHDQAYNIWRDAGVRNRTLVHIDAHHDMSWADDKTTITIVNFIWLALKQALIHEISKALLPTSTNFPSPILASSTL